MVNLNLVERIEIVRLVGDNARSMREAAEEFNRRHPDREPIHHSTVFRINTLFNRTGKVNEKRVPRQRENLEIDGQILQYVRENPKTSLRQMSRDLHVSVSKIRTCLKKNKVIPFKPKIMHTLERGDEEKRLEFCLFCQGEYLNDDNFLGNILFTDEATFTTNGTVSTQNSRYWATENPHYVIHAKRQYSQKINVWIGMYKNRLMGPVFFEQTLNGERFYNFLNTILWDFMEELTIEERRNIIFQLDGASIHNVIAVRRWLNETFRGRWIGRSSPSIYWPPRSPDLTPLDFFLWGYLKENVYQSRPQNVNELKERITQKCRQITPDQLRRTRQNLRRRYEKCIELEGGYIENTSI